jgi:hypothetical protein
LCHSKRVHETCNLHRKPQSIIEKFPSRISSVSLLQSNIFRPRIRTRLYLKMRPLLLSKAIELSLVTLWQVRTYTIAVCLSLPSHSWFPSYRVSLFFLCRTSYITTRGSENVKPQLVCIPSRIAQKVRSTRTLHLTYVTKHTHKIVFPFFSPDLFVPRKKYWF